MAAMMIVMVVFLVTSGHHGPGGSHASDPAKSSAATHMQSEAAKPEPVDE